VSEEFDRDKVYHLRMRSKTGSSLSEEELAFCERMMRIDPEAYKEIGRKVVEAIKDSYTA
jgi:hypothetical protein